MSTSTLAIVSVVPDVDLLSNLSLASGPARVYCAADESKPHPPQRKLHIAPKSQPNGSFQDVRGQMKTSEFMATVTHCAKSQKQEKKKSVLAAVVRG